MSDCDDQYRTDPLRIPKGDTWRMAWPLLDSTGQPLPTAGWTAKGQVRAYADSPDVLHEWTTENGGIVLADEQIMLVVEPETSLAWEWGQGVYDVEMYSPQGSKTTVLSGPVYAPDTVTQ